NTETHIERNETTEIVNWVKNDLANNQKNLTVLEGEKGIGKSVILKDVYDKLNELNYIVIGIKSDKYYASSPKELENQLFVNNITFDKIIELINKENRKLVVIIDQLDALSLTLSSNRVYLHTYN